MCGHYLCPPTCPCCDEACLYFPTGEIFIERNNRVEVKAHRTHVVETLFALSATLFLDALDVTSYADAC